MSHQNYFAIVRSGANLSTIVPIVGWDAVEATGDATPSLQTAVGFEAVYLPNMTAGEWQSRVNGSQAPMALSGGEVIPYIPLSPIVPLHQQAQEALTLIQTQATMAYAMGSPFGTKMQAYVKAVQAIANGTDTTSTALPKAPLSTSE
ncbi:hypothetical protein [Neokomagataea anthophila]|uniref:Phage tail protein n=1 Tax=Neokomagataea anthophila TaxID=2826925 RepID=A0ABS5E7Y0_9PROT|nr:hypothetical protein [Neokomagataea anthophila]MBR0560021.1 hypothetical protein [Neokomagataea anthophila]